jgi:nitronate monooxygenase
MISTRLTEALGIRHPVLSAPMALASGGRLAAAVTAAGGLGLVGGGYGNADWLTTQFAEAGNQAIGCGFITWSLAIQPELLDVALARKPQALMLSFGDLAPFAPQIHDAGVTLICQCQTMQHVRDAVEAKAGIIVLQGSEAGGHGMSRATLTLVPEAADFLASVAPDTLIVAAGGVADGRGLAAALMLGADGVLIGTRFWASEEALVHTAHHAAIMASDGDSTIRTTTPDVARKLDWPKGFTARVMQNDFTRKWHGQEAALLAHQEDEAAKYTAAFSAGNTQDAGVWFGEAAGLISSIEPAGVILERIVAKAESLLSKAARFVVKSG